MLNLTPVERSNFTRYSYGKINEAMEMPNLIEIQKASYNWFIEKGIKELFRDLEDISDFSGNLVLSFRDCVIDGVPKYSIRECKERDANYAAPMHVTVILYNKLKAENPIIEQQIYLGDFPLMTDSGTFIINGAERVIVSQLVRSPGVYFSMEHDKTNVELYYSTINPNRGAWLEYETDVNEVFSVRIDKARKIPVTTLIRALGICDDGKDDVHSRNCTIPLSSNDDIRAFFGPDEMLEATLAKDSTENTEEALYEIFRKLRPGEPVTLDVAKQQIDNLFFDPHRYDISRVGRYKYNKKLSMVNRLPGCVVSRPVIDEITGELIAEPGEVLTKEKAIQIEQAGIMRVVVDVNGSELYVISNGMCEIAPFLPDSITEEELDNIGINEKVRFGVLQEVLSVCGDDKEALLKELEARCDDLIPKHIIVDDILSSINYINCLTKHVGNLDDIDHLGNRRIRSVGELLQNQFRIGLAKMERSVREKINLQNQGDIDKDGKDGKESSNITPQSLVNIRPVMVAIKEFFGSSQLSQFMDQANPLAELTHKRRLSALGPGGLSRERAGFEVRDVHYSHYGRMCPIETPEGPNIGLISSLATFAKINKYGFVEAPFRRIDKETGVVLDEIVYMTADEEDDFIVAQANEPLDENNRFVKAKINARHRDVYLECDREMADFMDVSPKMVVSVATAMIPFLENDDANRALMGSNMQKQAVPLLKTQAPLVGTGMEYKAAVDSGVCVLAREDGVVIKVSADNVDIRSDDGRVEHYPIIKFMRSNQGTCFNQHPIVSVGQRVKANDVIADGPATDHGEISLGKNALVGFMTWEGYNYEDAVLINERLVRDDVYTSVHIEKYEIEARDTKLGPEEITRDIPNVGDDVLANLDEEGIIRIGAEVRSGDILVGKVTPKGETELTAEERLLRAIFGEKAKEVRDTSLKVPHGEYGIVVNVEVFTKDNCEEISSGINKIVRCYIAQKRKLSVGDKMAGRHGNKGVVSRILPQEDMPFLPDGTPLDIVLNPLGVPSRMNIGQVLEVHLGAACRALGLHIMTPVFDGAHEDDIRQALLEAGLDEDGKVQLIDGRTGRPFDNRVTVGVMYYLKLHHLVDDKIHARSTGPYSLVTQQPLGGKAQFGGQRFGEMEVWALEAYGAAYTLQEILTVKSDDVVGRVKAYEAIVKGNNIPTPGVPESFKVLVRELQALALDVCVYDQNGETVELKEDLEVGSIGTIVNDTKTFSNVNDADSAEGFRVVEDPEGLDNDDISAGSETEESDIDDDLDFEPEYPLFGDDDEDFTITEESDTDLDSEEDFN